MFIVGIDLVLCKEHYIMPTQVNCSMESCLTLSQFANNTTSYTESGNTTLFITADKNYTLDESITVSNTSQFSLLLMSKQDTLSVVICNEDAGFTFYNISSVLIRGLVFLGCSISRFDLVSQLSFQHLIFNGQNKRNTTLIITNSTVNITATSFVSNTAGLLLGDVSPQPSPSLSTTSTTGGALIVVSSNLTLESCVFDGNQANIGGAIFSESNSNITIRNSSFISNSAKDCDSGLCYGGVLFIERGRVVINDCNFTQNSADAGGVLSLAKCNASIANTGFSNNSATGNGGVIYAEEKASLHVQNGTFINNSARDGGVMSIISNENMVLNTESEIVIYSSNFSGNIASNDGAVIASDGDDLAFVESIFNDNRADNNGGVAHVRNNCTTEFTSCFFTNNRVGDSGGAIYGRDYSTITVTNTTFNNCRADDSGGGVYIQENGIASIYNSTFTNNSADYGGAVLAWRSSDVNIDSTTFQNNSADTDGGSLYTFAFNVTSQLRAASSSEIRLSIMVISLLLIIVMLNWKAPN
jgi:predicted outer membrane repeat protein